MNELSGLGDTVPNWELFVRKVGCSWPGGPMTEDRIVPGEGMTKADCVRRAQEAAFNSMGKRTRDERVAIQCQSPAVLVDGRCVTPRLRTDLRSGYCSGKPMPPVPATAGPYIRYVCMPDGWELDVDERAPEARCVGGDGSTRCGSPFSSIAVGEPHPSGSFRPPPTNSAVTQARLEAQRRELAALRARRKQLEQRARPVPAPRPTQTSSPIEPLRIQPPATQPAGTTLALIVAGIALTAVFSR